MRIEFSDGSYELNDKCIIFFENIKKCNSEIMKVEDNNIHLQDFAKIVAAIDKYFSGDKIKFENCDALKYFGCNINFDIDRLDTCTSACMTGNLGLLKYAQEIGCPMPDRACYYAAAHGHLDLLKYLHENGYLWCGTACESAAMGGHLDCLKYLHENGCPWTMYTAHMAASSGHLDCLKYAHENGCEWYPETFNIPNLKGKLECLEYARTMSRPQ